MEVILIKQHRSDDSLPDRVEIFEDSRDEIISRWIYIVV